MDHSLFSVAEVRQDAACDAADLDASWQIVPGAIRAGAQVFPAPWEGIFGSLRMGKVDDLVVVGQIGQSLDGRSATRSGDSHYINGPAGLAHLHRLRAIVDAVVVGVGTVLADDPQLTVRRVSGPHPARVVVDPNARLTAAARVLERDGVRRLVLTARGACCGMSDVEILTLPAPGGQIAPTDILSALAKLGFRRILIEGGAGTLSRFLAARCLDRLHVIVAPVILGAGRPSIILDSIDRMEHALRPPTRVHWLDGEVLFDCDLSAQRLPIECAKKST